MVRVKICCISSLLEAELAVRYGANCLGLVGNMPSGPGVIDDRLIRTISSTVPPGVSTFLLTSETTAAGVIAHHQRTLTDTIQLVDKLEPGELAKIRVALPGVKLVQVIHVRNEESGRQASAISPLVDSILLDSGNPTLPTKELGGTGRVHDWSLSRTIRETVTVPVFLAGGLRAENVAVAIKTVRPFGVDVCSGVRTEGQLTEEKLAAYFAALPPLR